MITCIGLRGLNSVVIPRLGFPFFQNFLSKFLKEIILKALGLDHAFLVRFPFPFKNKNKSGSLSLFYKN
jgi:hypothetical protein